MNVVLRVHLLKKSLSGLTDKVPCTCACMIILCSTVFRVSHIIVLTIIVDCSRCGHGMWECARILQLIFATCDFVLLC